MRFAAIVTTAVAASPGFSGIPGFDNRRLAAQADVTFEDPRFAPRCEGLQTSLIAAAADPDVSIASIAHAGASRGVLRHRGERFEDMRVVYIGAESIWLSRGDALCRVAFSRAPGPPAAEATAQPSAASALRVTRAAPLARGVSVVPRVQDGRTVGFRLSGLRPGGLLEMIGLASGDVLVAINGFELTSPAQALEAYARLRTASRITLVLLRNGKTMNLDYEIR